MTGKELIRTAEYDFLWDNPHLGNRIMFLTYGGSHSYGTNVALVECCNLSECCDEEK